MNSRHKRDREDDVWAIAALAIVGIAVALFVAYKAVIFLAYARIAFG